MRQAYSKTTPPSSSASTDASISLFDDYVAHKNGTKFLQVLRIRKKGASNGYVEYRMPVKFTDKCRKDIEVIGKLYTREGDGFRLQGETIRLTAADIVSQLNLSYDPARELFVCEEEELALIDQAVPVADDISPEQSSATSQASATDDGTVRTTVEPLPQVEGFRRSKRRRVVISHLTS